MTALRIKRGTRSQINSAGTAGTLAAGEPYLITDESRLALGTGTTTYVDFAKKSEVPTAVSALTNDAGYITTETDPIFTASAAAGITSTNITNWNTAYGWGNHASAGYLTGITSGQVTTALGFTPENAANKGVAGGYASLDGSGLVPSTQLPSYVDDVLEYADTAAFPATGESGKIYVAVDTSKTYRWSGSTYVEISASPGTTDALTEGSTNLYFTTARARASISAAGSLSYNSTTGVVSYTAPTAVSAFTNDAGYITSFTETDPVFAASAAAGVTTTKISNWDTAYSWGNHASAGYLTSFTETDPVFAASAAAGITASNITNWNTAYGWGNHASAGYLTSITGTQVTTALGYTPYNAANPSGYTSNTGTVTSVSGTGTVSGLTLTGTVTGSGSLTLGGTLSLTSGNVTTALGYTPASTSSPTFTGTVTTATADLLGSVRGNVTAVAASAIDCSAGNYFTKTASGALTWTVTNVPASRAYSFILELTNGGTGTQTWFSGIKWPGGTAPTLTTSGVDVLGFITDDGGTTWRGVQLMKDSK